LKNRIALVLLLSQAAWAADDNVRQILMQALENQYRGRYQADMELVNETFPGGKDSLTGLAEFADESGQRKMTLAAPGQQKSFEYQSLNFGQEQWLVDGTSKRVRRI